MSKNPVTEGYIIGLEYGIGMVDFAIRWELDLKWVLDHMKEAKAAKESENVE